jgi:hypothetical protein
MRHDIAARCAQVMRAGAAGLAASELCVVRGFTLRDAISAAEVGDAKMDPGPPRDPEAIASSALASGARATDAAHPLLANPILTYTHGRPDSSCSCVCAAAAGALPLCPTAEALVAVMDKILALEVSWHRGNALPHTLLSCAYMTRTAVSALRAVLSLPPLLAAAAPPMGEHGGSPIISTVVGISPAPRGSATFTAAYALLAYITATARCVDSIRAVVLAADIFEVRPFVVFSTHTHARTRMICVYTCASYP